MKKLNKALAAVLMALCLLAMTGCSQLFAMHDPPERTVTPSPTATRTAGATPTASPEAPTPTPTMEPTPTAAPTLAPLPKDLVQIDSFVLDVDGDGANDSVVITTTDEDYGNVYIGVLTSDGYDRVAVDEGFYSKVWSGKTQNGEPCVLVTLDLGSDDYLTCVFSFSDGKPVMKYRLSAYVSNVSESSVTVRDDLVMLGSWVYTCEYKITSHYTLQQTSEMMLDMEYKDPPHTIRPLPVQLLDGNVYSDDTLPVGTLIYPISTNGSSYMKFRLEDGREGRVIGSFDGGYTFKINGLDESQYFDNLDYWG